MWRARDHTADVLLEVEAPSWIRLLEEAARAWGEWVSGGQPIEEAPLEKSIRVQGSDAVETWVRHWRGLHRLWTVEEALAVGASVGPGAQGLLARVRCVSVVALDLSRCADVKAVTWHGARIAEREDGVWVGEIVLDL